MPSPADNYAVNTGVGIYGGRAKYVAPKGNFFDAVEKVSEVPGEIPTLAANQVMIVTMHGSGGGANSFAVGRQFRAAVSGPMAHHTHNEFAFYTCKGGTGQTLLRPINYFTGTTPVEDMWLGFKLEDGKVHLTSHRRLMAMLEWSKTNVPNVVQSKNCCTGGSMGGWGTLTTGIRRPDFFAALYPDRPRWRYAGIDGKIAVINYGSGNTTVFINDSPLLAPEDGGGTFASFLDNIAYVSNTANKIPWIGWCIGWQDGYTTRADHVAAVAAMRAAKRGFAIAWNNGDHGAGSIMNEITASYPFGTFEIGKGYPLFTNHSGDGDPAVDLVGGINIGLSFRNVVETSTGWSCEVTSILGARTVEVEPISEVFTKSVTKKVVTIPAANSWVSVSFD